MSNYLNDRPDDDRRLVTEVCPNCDNEVSMVWDVEQNGYKATCPYCGGRLMLCDECQHPNGAYSDDCDYDALTKSCRYNCAANYQEAEKVVKLLSQFCKGRAQQAARLKLHSACIGCGKCEKLCPLNNITLQNARPVWGTNCTQCMACICYCPTRAIEYGKKSAGKPRYHFEEL